jgi:hypothetical protein
MTRYKVMPLWPWLSTLAKPYRLVMLLVCRWLVA